MDNLRVNMGKRMKERRKLLHYTQEDMAEKLNISLKHYGAVERGNAGLSLENMVEVSEIFGVGLDYLVRGIPEQENMIPSRIEQIILSFPKEKRQYLLQILEVLVKF